jgi:hypothetical protein
LGNGLSGAIEEFGVEIGDGVVPNADADSSGAFEDVLRVDGVAT